MDRVARVLGARLRAVRTRHPFTARTTPLRFFSAGHQKVSLPDDKLSLQDFVPKSPLEDTFGRHHTYLRISLSERCNLRCQYCMPEGGVDLTPNKDLLTTDEIIRIIQLFVEEGITKVRFTGGEPLLRQDLKRLIEEVNEFRPLGLETIALTTNGVNLPRKLDGLLDAGLNAINLSLDTLDPMKFHLITRRNGFAKVMHAIELCLANKERFQTRIKVNCVVMNGQNEKEIVDFVSFTQERDVEVRFIEYMPFDGNRWNHDRMVSFDKMKELIRAEYPELAAVGDSPHDVSKTYHVPGFQGRVGFITSMSEHFCGGCNRLRITADGNLKVCLFGSAESSLRDVLRSGGSDEQLRETIMFAVQRKKASHDGMFAIANSKNRPMTTIGG